MLHNKQFRREIIQIKEPQTGSHHKVYEGGKFDMKLEIFNKRQYHTPVKFKVYLCLHMVIKCRNVELLFQ